LKRFGPPALVVALGVALFFHARYYFPFISDDALISLRYARRFAKGLGLTWTDGERVEGYTNLLWVLLNGASRAIGFDLIWSARVLGTLGVFLAILCASVVPRPLALSPVRALSGGLFFALSSPLAVWAIGGLEQGFLAGMLAGAFVALARVDGTGASSPNACFAAGGFLGAVALLRADGLGLVLCATAGFILAGKLKPHVLGRAALVLAIPLGLLALQLLFRYVYYGALVPNTALVKVSFNQDRLLGGLHYVRDGFRPLLPVLGLTLVALVAGFRGLRPERVLPPLVVLVGWSSYIALVGGDIFPGWRQLVPSVVGLGMLLAEGADAASRRFRFGVPVVVGLSVPVLAFALFFQTVDRENVRAKNELWEHDGRPLGYLLKKAFAEKKPLLAVDSAGALPYWSDLPCLDLLGLNDRYIATHPPPNFGHGGIGHELGNGAYVLRRRPDLVAFNGPVAERNPMFLSGKQLVATRAFQREYQLVRARGRGAIPVGEFWMRREGGKVGVTRTPDRIHVPGYFFGSGSGVAELDANHRLVANNEGPYNAELPKFELPAGTWEVLLDTDIAPGGVAFRCDGVSAAQTGIGQVSLELDAPRPVDVIVGAAPKGVVAIRSATFVRRPGPGGFRCAARGDRLVVPLAQLSKRKEEQSAWDALSNVLLQAAGVRVLLPELSHAKKLELSVDGNDGYAILFARGSQVEGSVTLEQGKRGGMTIKRIDVPEPVRTTGFDRVEIVPMAGDNYYSVGHLFVHGD
jgi:hypothetical protein